MDDHTPLPDDAERHLERMQAAAADLIARERRLRLAVAVDLVAAAVLGGLLIGFALARGCGH